VSGCCGATKKSPNPTILNIMHNSKMTTVYTSKKHLTATKPTHKDNKTRKQQPEHQLTIFKTSKICYR